MADFVLKSDTKTAIRQLATPIGSVADFDAIVSNVINTNPWGCTAYEVAGVAQQPVARSRESYVAKIIYENVDGKTVGSVSAKTSTLAGFNAANTQILGDSALQTAMGGTAIRDTEHESYSVAIKCHDPNGEVYYVTISRNSVRVSSYTDEGIRTKVETWADGVPDLA